MRNLHNLTYVESTTTGANIVGAPPQDHYHEHGPECTCHLVDASALRPPQIHISSSRSNLLSPPMTYSPAQFQKESHSVRVSKNNKNDGDPIVNKLQKNRVVKQGRISPTNVVASRKRYYNASEARI